MDQKNTDSQAPEKARIVREGIMRGLHSNQFVPGQRLVESDLSELFDSPRGYVREALLRLESEGLVEIRPYRGARIRIFTEKEAIDIDLAITALMALAAKQAADRVKEGHGCEMLKAALKDVVKYSKLQDAFYYATSVEKFYRSIIELSGNAEVDRICPLMQGHIAKRKLGGARDSAHFEMRSVRHQNICAAICHGDGKSAEAAFWAALSSHQSPEAEEAKAPRQ